MDLGLEPGSGEEFVTLDNGLDPTQALGKSSVQEGGCWWPWILAYDLLESSMMGRKLLAGGSGGCDLGFWSRSYFRPVLE